MSTMPSPRWQYLAPKPGSRYKQLFIRGKNIAARTLYGLYVDGDEPGMSPEDIAVDYGLPIVAVREAIAYCQSNPPEIQADWEAEEALAKATGTAKKGPGGNAASATILSPSEMARLQSP